MSTALQRRVPPDDHPGDGWWTDIERDVLACLGPHDASPAQIAARIGVSEAAVCSVISMLATEGKVRISRIQLV